MRWAGRDRPTRMEAANIDKISRKVHSLRLSSVLTAFGSVLVFTSVPAAAAHAAAAVGPQSAPQSGSSFALVEDGDMVLACEGTVHRFDLHGTGQFSVGDKATAPDGTRNVALTTVSENLVGFDPALGTVTVTEATPAVGELASPVPGKMFPASESFAQDVTVSMEHTPCDDSGAPVTFRNAAPFSLLNGNLKAFPPQGAVYVLPGNVELKPVGAPHQPSVTLLQFPVSVSHNA